MFTILGGDGKEYGPVSVAQIRNWIAAGRANLETQAKAQGSDEWRRLGDFPEFSTVEPPPLLPSSSGYASTDGQDHATDLATLPSRWLRLAAALIDGVLRMFCVLPTVMAVMRAAIAQAESGRTDPDPAMIIGVVRSSIAHSLPYLLALVIVQCVLLSVRGQTIGKLPCRLRIVRHDDSAPVGFVRAVLLRGVVPSVIEQIPLLGALFWIVDSCFIFSEEKRCLHDLIADTKVVATH